MASSLIFQNFSEAHRAPPQTPPPVFSQVGLSDLFDFALNSHALWALDSGFALDSRALSALDSDFTLN